MRRVSPSHAPTVARLLYGDAIGAGLRGFLIDALAVGLRVREVILWLM